MGRRNKQIDLQPSADEYDRLKKDVMKSDFPILSQGFILTSKWAIRYRQPGVLHLMMFMKLMGGHAD